MKRMNVEKVAKAIEADAGMVLPDLRQALAEAKAGIAGVVHGPEQIEARKRGRPMGSTKEKPKVSTTIRFDPDVLEALKASGPGWQTRVNETVRSSLKRARQL